MSGYLFYPPADAVQDRIWRDTAEKWGEAQAVIGVMAILHERMDIPCGCSRIASIIDKRDDA